MKAISLWQPWASLWCSPAKVHETRHWYTATLGWVAVHAAKKLVPLDDDDPLDEICRRTFGMDWPKTLPRGAIVGAVQMVRCARTSDVKPIGDDLVCGDFGEGRYAWERAAYVALANPVPWVGRHGFFGVDMGKLPDLRRLVLCRG